MTNKISDYNVKEMRNNMDTSDIADFDKFVEVFKSIPDIQPEEAAAEEHWEIQSSVKIHSDGDTKSDAV